MSADRGLFVVIDGPSGIGKSTVSTLLHSELVTRGVPTVLTAEPSRSRVGELARYGTNVYSGLALACLVAADRYHHLATEVRPALKAGKVVICDRYVPSSLVLQQLDGVDADFLAGLNRHAERPDLAVILTGDPRRSRQRAAQRGVYSRFHEGSTAAAVRENKLYCDIAEELTAAGWNVLHHELGDERPEGLAEIIFGELMERFNCP